MLKIPLKLNHLIFIIAIFLVGSFYTTIDTLTYKMNSDVPCVMQFIEPGPTCLYYNLAKAFEHGQLSLLQKPSPQLLNSTDPYNFLENSQYKLLDMSFFQGKYYVYYGPTNAIAILIAHVFNSNYIITDGRLNYIWSIGLLILMAIFFNFFTHKINIQNLFCLKSIDHHLPFSLALFGFFLTTINAGIVNCLLFRRFYEAVVTGGAFFFWFAIIILLYALSAINTKKFLETPAKIYRLFMYSGLALLFSYFSAPSNSIVMLFLGIMIPSIVTYYYKKNEDLSLLKIFKCILAFEIPLAITLLISFIYNYKRFGSIFENGFLYTISGFPSDKLFKYSFNFDHILPNFYLYFFQNPLILKHFPFIIYKTVNLPHWIPNKNRFISFGAIGLVWEKLISLPMLFFLGIILIKLAVTKIRPPFPTYDRMAINISIYLGSIFFLISLLQMAPLLFFIAGEERFMVHFNFAFTISLLFFAYTLINYTQLIFGTGFRIVFITCVYLTGILSILLVVFSLFGYNELFGSLVKNTNPTFYTEVENKVNKIIHLLPVSSIINS